MKACNLLELLGDEGVDVEFVVVVEGVDVTEGVAVTEGMPVTEGVPEFVDVTIGVVDVMLDGEVVILVVSRSVVCMVVVLEL